MPRRGMPLAYYSIRWLPARNQNAAQAPAFGLVKVVSVDPKGLYTVDQPDTDSMQVFGTNFVPIQAGNAGPGAVTNDWPWWVIYDQANDGDPAVGDIMGAGAGTWFIKKGKTGFRVVGVDTVRTLAKVILAPSGMSGGSLAQVQIAGAGGVIQIPQGDTTFDANLVTLDPVTLAPTVGAPCWFFDPNLPTGMLGTQILDASANGNHNGRPLYVRDDFKAIWLNSDGTVFQKGTVMQEVGKDPNGVDDLVISSPGPRITTINTKGITFTVQVCEGDGLLHTWTIGDGLIKGRT